MPPPFNATDKGIDLNRYNGTIHQLRGMADLGHVCPHLVGDREYVTYVDVDGTVHLLEYVSGIWRHENLSNIMSSPPIAVGDPVGIAIGNEQMLFYRVQMLQFMGWYFI